MTDHNDVICLVRKKSDSLPSVVKQINGDLKSLQISEECNLNDTDSLSLTVQLNQVLSDCDVVVHSAARAHITREGFSEPLSEYRKVNRDATLVLARLAAEAGVKRFVYISSIGVNGNQNIYPFSEIDKPDPHDPYSISKFEAEQGLVSLVKETDMEVVIIRPPLVYGPGAPGNFARLVKWVKKGVPLPLGLVSNKRSLVALDNLVDFIVLCADRELSPKAANEVFMISDDEDISTSELLSNVANAYNVKSRLLPIPVGIMKYAAKLLGKSELANRLFGNLQIDSSKARDLLRWNPVVTMEEQLAKMVREDNNLN